MSAFAPVGNGLVLCYVVARPNERLAYVRGSNVVRLISGESETRVAAIGDGFEALSERPASQPIDLPKPPSGAIRAALERRSELDLFVNEEGIDLATHARFLISIHALIPKVRGGEDFFFEHQADVQGIRRARALYGGAFHGGLTARGHDPGREVEVRPDLRPTTIAVEPGGAGRYKIKVTTGSGSLWASDSDPRIGGQEFALALDPDPPDWTRDAVIYQ